LGVDFFCLVGDPRENTYHGQSWEVSCHIMVDKCCMHKRNMELVDYLLLHWKVAFALLSAFFSRFGLSWVMPRSVVDLYACWWTVGGT